MSLTVVRAVGLVTVQDAGRPGHMHEGLAPGGAFVPELLAAANHRVQNLGTAAAIEVMGLIEVRASTPVTVATSDLAARRLQSGETLTVASGSRSVTYLAVRGGIDAPVVLGSRSTQLSAGIGSLIRPGTTLPIGHEPASVQRVEPFEAGGRVRIIAGPDLDAFAPDAIEVLTSHPYVMSAETSRVGARLDGPALERRELRDVTRPMVVGAIEVPADGRPIVLGPEHPTTGGYPVLAVVACADRGRFFATPIGSTVWFVAGDAPGRAAERLET